MAAPPTLGHRTIGWLCSMAQHSTADEHSRRNTNSSFKQIEASGLPPDCNGSGERPHRLRAPLIARVPLARSSFCFIYFFLRHLPQVCLFTNYFNRRCGYTRMYLYSFWSLSVSKGLRRFSSFSSCCKHLIKLKLHWLGAFAPLLKHQ